MLTLTLLELQAAQFEMPPPPKRHQFSPVATKDGYIHIAIASERTFEGIADAADRPDWKTDPRFAKYIDRRRNWADFMEEIESWSRTLTSAEALDALERHTVPASPYRSVKEVMADPQLAHRQSLAEVKDKAGSFKALNPPFRLTASDTTTGATVAALGEHTAEVLASAGLSAEELAALTKGNAKAK
jgi:crotonobetainyl-CoA:carnitine CoA-transferase CaiB-like acyl-CoA transferase